MAPITVENEKEGNLLFSWRGAKIKPQGRGAAWKAEMLPRRKNRGIRGVREGCGHGRRGG